MEGDSNHSEEWKQEMGCSEVAIRYLSVSVSWGWGSVVVVVVVVEMVLVEFLVEVLVEVLVVVVEVEDEEETTTLYNSSSNCSNCAVLAIISLFIKNGGCNVVYPLSRRKCSPYVMRAWFRSIPSFVRKYPLWPAILAPVGVRGLG